MPSGRATILILWPTTPMQAVSKQQYTAWSGPFLFTLKESYKKHHLGSITFNTIVIEGIILPVFQSSITTFLWNTFNQRFHFLCVCVCVGGGGGREDFFPQVRIKNLRYLYIYMWRHIFCLTRQIDYAKDYLCQYLYYLSHLIMQVIDCSNCSAGQ